MPPKKQLTPQKKSLWNDTYRIIDANLNRCKEGLRVCEDIARFHLKSKPTTQKIAALRHRIASIVNTCPCDKRLLYRFRDTDNDPGKRSFLGPQRRSFKDIFMANAQRVKEALRVLEEFFKLIDTKASKQVQKLRFDFYALEKKTIERFPALLDPR